MSRYRVTGHTTVEAESEADAAEIAGYSETEWEVGRVSKIGPTKLTVFFAGLIAATGLPGERLLAAAGLV